jgi:hypothetical protein
MLVQCEFTEYTFGCKTIPMEKEGSILARVQMNAQTAFAVLALK